MAETRLTPDIELDGLTPDEAFAVLGDEIRLDIVRVLWKAGALHEYDDLDDTAATISFSTLRRRVDIDDNGQFNYHLSKLVPHFVRQTDDGYRLSEAGKKIARTVIAISGEPDPEVSDEVTTDCPMCGAPITASYEDQWLRFRCTECDGLFGDGAPEGTILNSPFPPAGLTGQGPDEALETGLYRCHLDLAYMMGGICRECAAPVTGSLSVCDDHQVTDDPYCDNCGTPFEAWGELRCDACRFAKRLPLELCVLGLTPVIGFFNSHDIDVLAPSFDELFDVVGSKIEASVTQDPPRATVDIQADGDALTLTLDGDLTVLDVDR